MIVRPDSLMYGEELHNTECLLCGLRFRSVAILWAGVSGNLWLHSHCVTDLAVRMFRDVHEVNKPDYYAGRERRAVLGAAEPTMAQE